MYKLIQKEKKKFLWTIGVDIVFSWPRALDADKVQIRKADASPTPTERHGQYDATALKKDRQISGRCLISLPAEELEQKHETAQSISGSERERTSANDLVYVLSRLPTNADRLSDALD